MTSGFIKDGFMAALVTIWATIGIAAMFTNAGGGSFNLGLCIGAIVNLYCIKGIRPGGTK